MKGGLRGPAANSELVLYEFMNVLTRVSFMRLNPEYGELTMEHQDSLLPVPQCLERAIKENILPRAHRDDAAEFRTKTMQMPEVQAALAEGRPRLQAWFATIPLDENQKVGITQWISTLQALNVIGTFTCTQGSDIVGDDRVGTEFKCRLSVQQCKAAFVNAQKEGGGAVEDTTLDFDELLECIARCGVDKYRAVEQIKTGEKVSAMIANILGDLNEEQVITAATYITAERFTPAAAPPKGVTPDSHKEWLMTWEMLQLTTLPGFPLWEKDVHDVLAANLESLQSIFRAYAASSLEGSSTEIDMEEFHDFVIEADLITGEYGFDTVRQAVSIPRPLGCTSPCLLALACTAPANPDVARSTPPYADERPVHQGQRGLERHRARVPRVPHHARAHLLLPRQPAVRHAQGQGPEERREV